MMRFIATFGYSGLLKPAPGTWGSAAAVLVALGVDLIGGVIALAIGVLALFALGLEATKAMTQTGDHDPSWIVIDEVVGQWIALFPVAYLAGQLGGGLINYPFLVIIAFALFRLFDIWKPGLIGQADQRGDAAGVMLDDVWAGVYAACGTTLVIVAMIYFYAGATTP